MVSGDSTRCMSSLSVDSCTSVSSVSLSDSASSLTVSEDLGLFFGVEHLFVVIFTCRFFEADLVNISAKVDCLRTVFDRD